MAKDLIVKAVDLRSYFHGAVLSAIDNQKLNSDDATVWYLTNLLTDYSRSEQFFDHTQDGRRLLPLAELYGKAFCAQTRHIRDQWLRRLGDVALFVAGLFVGFFERRPIDVDYYVAMGGSAYYSLVETNESEEGQIYARLAGGFVSYMDVLAEIGESRVQGQLNPLRQYELWRKTGSLRLAKQLRAERVHLCQSEHTMPC